MQSVTYYLLIITNAIMYKQHFDVVAGKDGANTHYIFI